MRDVLLIGGTSSGKTELAKEMIAREPRIHRIYTSEHAVTRPFCMQEQMEREGRGNLFSLTKEEYIAAIVGFEGDLGGVVIPRSEKDIYINRPYGEYGMTIVAETVNAARIPGRLNLIDNLAKAVAIEWLKKEQGLFVVGVGCSQEVRAQRKTANFRPDDVSEEARRSSSDIYATFLAEIQRSDDFFETESFPGLSDLYFDSTDHDISVYSGWAEQVLDRIR